MRDLFGGSGATIIGTEQARRRVFLVGNDPVEVDVNIRRWELLAGNQAEQAV